MRFGIPLLALSIGAFGCAFSAAGEPPPVLDRIENPELLTSLAISAGGDRAVGAVPEEDDGRRSTIMFYTAARAETVAVEVAAQVRALLLEGQAPSALALLHRSAKRSEGETYLARVDPQAAKATRLVRLPTSAVDLDYWPARHALLVSCRNEIRTLLLPEMRSGPLYRVMGDNRAVASLAGGSLILVGQDAGLLLVDLDATQGKEEMPVQSAIPMPQPVTSISAAADGSYALVTLVDDSVRKVNIDTLLMSAPLEPVPPSPEPVVAAEVIEEPESVPPEPEPAVVTEIVEQPEPEAAMQPAGPPAQVRGRIADGDLSAVAAVVLLGPDNLLREAARIIPKSDGSWSAGGLQPGRYRVQLDGGGRVVLLTDPPFLLIDVKEGGTADAGDIRLLKAL